MECDTVVNSNYTSNLPLLVTYVSILTEIACDCRWTDTGPKGGGTFLASDSVRHQARLFARHPGGLPCVPRNDGENRMNDASAAYARAERGGEVGDGGDDSIIGLCAGERRYELLGNAGCVFLNLF